MAGFPIVSLGAITSLVDNNPQYNPNKASIVIPQFEVDEYFNGNETLAINKYSGGYYLSNYVESIAIKPNNISASTGVQSTISGSYGFSFDESQTWNNSIYSIEYKIENLQRYRIDSFYCTTFPCLFLWQNGLIISENDINNDKNVYVNVPNLVKFVAHHTFSISSFTEKVYLNIPNITNFGVQLFNSLNESIEIIFNVYLNSQPISFFGIYVNKDLTISSTNLSNATELRNYFWTNRAVSATNPNVNFKGTMVVGRDNVSLDEFDIRYWQLWQNTTGSDR